MWNIILDPILMIIMGEYAIEGAALATITAQFVQAVVTLHYFMKNSKIQNSRQENAIVIEINYVSMIQKLKRLNRLI